MQPAPFMPLSVYSSIVPPQSSSPAHCPISLHSSEILYTSQYLAPSGLHPHHLLSPGWPSFKWHLQFLDSPSISIIDYIGFLSSSPLLFVCRVCAPVNFFDCLPLIHIIPFWQGLQSDNLIEINILTLHICLQSSLFQLSPYEITFHCFLIYPLLKMCSLCEIHGYLQIQDVILRNQWISRWRLTSKTSNRQKFPSILWSICYLCKYRLSSLLYWTSIVYFLLLGRYRHPVSSPESKIVVSPKSWRQSYIWGFIEVKSTYTGRKNYFGSKTEANKFLGIYVKFEDIKAYLVFF